MKYLTLTLLFFILMLSGCYDQERSMRIEKCAQKMFHSSNVHYKAAWKACQKEIK